MMIAKNADNAEVAGSILQNIDTFLFDCDGVLWSRGKIFAGAVEVISGLKKLGKKVGFVTNNSTKTRAQYLDKIRDFGINAEINEIFCTAYISAQHLKNHLGPQDEVYVVGNPAMGAELDSIGVKHHGIGPDDEITSLDFDRTKPLNPNVKAVLAGFDGLFSFSKLTKAASYLARDDRLFVATNMDAQFPLKSCEYVMPGTGSIIISVATAAGRQPTVCGKPESIMYDCVKEGFQFDPKRTMMVGDRLDTDILFGNKNNLQTLLVMTGVTSPEKLNKVQQQKEEESQNLIPDFFIGSISDLGKYL